MTECAGQPLSGKAALVTGGGTGIGDAISRRLAALGAAVAVHQRTADRAQATVHAIRNNGGRAEAFVADLRAREGCEVAVAGCVSAFGTIDVLVNNAAVTGTAARTPLSDLDDERLLDVVAVNLTAVIRLSALAANAMSSGAVIVNIGSTGGYVAQRDCPAYVATKTALIGLTRSLAVDLADRGIRAVHVAPGDIETATSNDRDPRRTPPLRTFTPIGRRGTPEDVASVVGFVCTPDAAFVTGSSIVVDGGFIAY
ncbi:MAG: 3-oxoacyl-[acyl-carrier protein] reductase [Solirubrobacteraceae bacterium]